MASKIISFSYVPQPLIDPSNRKIFGEIFVPLIEVRLSYKNYLSRPFDALVDSGSDINIFPAHIGQTVGINITGSRAAYISGIGGARIKTFPHPIKLLVVNKLYPTKAYFSYEQREAILGRNGFFNLFKSVNFNEKERFVDIELQ